MDYKIEVMNWCQTMSQKPQNLFVFRLLSRGFDYEQIYYILIDITETCQRCWDNDSWCACINK